MSKLIKERHAFLMTVYTEKSIKDLSALIRIRAAMLEGIDLAAPGGGIEIVPVTLGMQTIEDYNDRVLVGIPAEVHMLGVQLEDIPEVQHQPV